MLQNSKTRYFTRLPFIFGQKSWSLGLGVSFCFHVSWELLTLWSNILAMLSFSECLEPGSFHSKLTFFLELSTGKLQKCQKRCVFDAKSLQTWELLTGSSKYVKNHVLFRKHRIVFYVTKLSHCVLHHFLGAWMLIWLLSFAWQWFAQKYGSFPLGTLLWKKTQRS